jgi:hypothetical protein
MLVFFRLCKIKQGVVMVYHSTTWPCHFYSKFFGHGCEESQFSQGYNGPNGAV